MNTPCISVYLEAKKAKQIYVLELCVSNDGTGTAYNVQFPAETETERFKHVGIIQNGIPVLRPNQVKRTQIDAWERLTDTTLSKIADQYEEQQRIRYTYQDFRNKKYKRELPLDFRTAYDFEKTDA